MRRVEIGERTLPCDLLVIDAPRAPAYELCAQAGAELRHEPRRGFRGAPLGGQPHPRRGLRTYAERSSERPRPHPHRAGGRRDSVGVGVPSTQSSMRAPNIDALAGNGDRVEEHARRRTSQSRISARSTRLPVRDRRRGSSRVAATLESSAGDRREEDRREEQLAGARAHGHGAEQGPRGGHPDRPEQGHQAASGPGPQRRGRRVEEKGHEGDDDQAPPPTRKATTPSALPHQSAARWDGRNEQANEGPTRRSSRRARSDRGPRPTRTRWRATAHPAPRGWSSPARSPTRGSPAPRRGRRKTRSVVTISRVEESSMRRSLARMTSVASTKGRRARGRRGTRGGASGARGGHGPSLLILTTIPTIVKSPDYGGTRSREYRQAPRRAKRPWETSPEAMSTLERRTPRSRAAKRIAVLYNVDY